MARIYKKGNSYYYSIETGKDADGKRRRLIRGGFSTKKEARCAADDMQIRCRSDGPTAEQNDIRLHDFIWDSWFKHYRQFVKPSTAYSVTTIVKRIDTYFCNRIRLRDITLNICEKFCRYLMEKTSLIRASIKKTFIYLNLSLEHAVKVERIIEHNPLEYFSVPRESFEYKEAILTAKFDEHLYLEPKQLAEFLSEAKKDKYAFFYYTPTLMLAYTGMRIGELLALQWKDIDWQHKKLYVRHGRAKIGPSQYILQSPKTAAGIRDITLPNKLIAALKAYRREYLELKLRCMAMWWQGQYDFVFISKNRLGLPFTREAYSQWLKKVGRPIGMDYLHPHVFRHTHVSLLAAAGIDLAVIKQRLGHHDDKVTERIYLHITQARKQEAAQKLDAVNLF